jgi:hypothetical protein
MAHLVLSGFERSVNDRPPTFQWAPSRYGQRPGVKRPGAARYCFSTRAVSGSPLDAQLATEFACYVERSGSFRLVARVWRR